MPWVQLKASGLFESRRLKILRTGKESGMSRPHRRHLQRLKLIFLERSQSRVHVEPRTGITFQSPPQTPVAPDQLRQLKVLIEEISNIARIENEWAFDG